MTTVCCFLVIAACTSCSNWSRASAVFMFFRNSYCAVFMWPFCSRYHISLTYTIISNSLHMQLASEIKSCIWIVVAVGCDTRCSVCCFDSKTAVIVVDAEGADAACCQYSVHLLWLGSVCLLSDLSDVQSCHYLQPPLAHDCLWRLDMMDVNRTVGDSGSHLSQDILNASRCQTCLAINRRKKSIACRTCSNQFHLSCVGLTRIREMVFLIGVVRVTWGVP